MKHAHHIFEQDLHNPEVGHLARHLFSSIHSGTPKQKAHAYINLMRQERWELVPYCLAALKEADISIDLVKYLEMSEDDPIWATVHLMGHRSFNGLIPIELVGLALARWQNDEEPKYLAALAEWHKFAQEVCGAYYQHLTDELMTTGHCSPSLANYIAGEALNGNKAAIELRKYI